MEMIKDMNIALERAGGHLIKRLNKHADRRRVWFVVFWQKRFSKAVRRWKDALK